MRVLRIDGNILKYAGDNPSAPESDEATKVQCNTYFFILTNENEIVARVIPNEDRENTIRDAIDYTGNVIGTTTPVSGIARVDEYVFYKQNTLPEDYEFSDVNVIRGEIHVTLFLPPKLGWLSVTKDEHYDQASLNVGEDMRMNLYPHVSYAPVTEEAERLRKGV